MTGWWRGEGLRAFREAPEGSPGPLDGFGTPLVGRPGEGVPLCLSDGDGDSLLPLLPEPAAAAMPRPESFGSAGGVPLACPRGFEGVPGVCLAGEGEEPLFPCRGDIPTPSRNAPKSGANP